MGHDFNLACRTHARVRDCATESRPLAEALWGAVCGLGQPRADSYGEALQDSLPARYAAQLARGESATAYALACAWEHLALARVATPFERRELARKVWAAFTERAEAADEIERGFGCDDSDAWEFAEDTTPAGGSMVSVEQVARLAGRIFAQLSRAKAERVTAVPEEVYDVELGADLSKLLPSELQHLGQPTEVLLLDNLVNSKCLQYKMRGSSEAGRGPLVICLDESSSMHEGRRAWSKAAAIALTRVAWEDDRKVSVIHYSVSVRIRELETGDQAALLAVIRNWLDGGTQISLALENAASEVERLQGQGDKGADVVLISDGVDKRITAQSRAIDQIEATDARLWTVAIECEIPRGNPLRDRAAEYVSIGGAELHEGGLGAMKDAVL